MKAVFLIPILLLSPFILIAQPDRSNLDFEDLNPVGGGFSSWYKTFIKPVEYNVSLDSSIAHHGRNSMRISYDTSGKSPSNGQVLNLIPIDVIGKTIRISGFARLANKTDTAWINFSINQDKEQRKKKVRSLMITNETDWKEYSWSISLDSFQLPLYNVGIYSFLKTKGTLWLDDFKIEIDGQNILDLRPYSSAEGETIKPLTAIQRINLELLGRTWGFLKYYHPIVAKGELNWDMELFRMISVAKETDNITSFSDQLVTWINGLGEMPSCRKCYTEIPKDEITHNLDQRWMNELASPALSARLKDVIAHRHQGESAYIKAEPVGNLLFENENEYIWREKNYPNEKFRLQFLFRYWNTIEYFSPYRNIIGKDWGDVLKEFLPRFSEARDSMEYQVLVNTFVNSVNDSHTGSFNQVLSSQFAPLYLPVQIKIVDDQAVVFMNYNDSLAKLDDLRRGDVIESIDGKSIKQLIDERKDWVNGSNYPVKLRSLINYNFLTGGKDSSVRVVINRDGKKVERNIRRYLFRQLRYRQEPDPPRWKLISPEIGYVNMGLLDTKDVDSMMVAMSATKAIIFDVRNYPRGTGQLICSYLYDKPTDYAWVTRPNLDYPGTYQWARFRNGFRPSDNKSRKRYHYKGKTLLLVNESTQSHAEWTSMALQATPGSITIGSQTSGADGNASKLYLTGNYFTYLTGLGIFYPDGKQTQRTGIRIDQEVKPTIKGIREGRDEVLEKALEIARQ